MSILKKPSNQWMARNMSEIEYVAYFFSRCSRTEKGCFEFQGGRNGKGYSQVSVKNKRWMLHRFIYAMTKGAIPDGHQVLHDCDNPPCCNPAHLRTGTMADNAVDSVDKVRHFHASQTHCKHGHEFTDENTYIAKVPGRPGMVRRQCKECQRTMQRKRWYANREQMLAHQKRYREKKRQQQQAPQ